MNEDVIIYTDGAARGNPGRGGYGVVLLSGNLKKKSQKVTGLPLTIEWNSWV